MLGEPGPLRPEHGGDLVGARRRYGVEHLLDFSSNLNPLGPPPGLLLRLGRGLRSVLAYPDPHCREARRALSRWLGVRPEELLLGNGSVELLYLLCHALPFRRALVVLPTFAEYAYAVRIAGGEVRSLSPEEGLRPTLEAILEAIREVELIFLCNPNNPTGQLWTGEELGAILEEARRRGAMLVLDEAFIEFAPEGFSLVREAPRRPNLLVLRSLTKSFALAGLRLGYLVARAELVERVSRWQPPWSVNALAQLAAVECAGRADHLRRTRGYLRRERRLLERALGGFPELEPLPSAANFLLVRLRGVSAAGLSAELARRGVLVRDCSGLPGLRGEFIRVAVRRRRENLRLISVLREALGG